MKITAFTTVVSICGVYQKMMQDRLVLYDCKGKNDQLQTINDFVLVSEKLPFGGLHF